MGTLEAPAAVRELVGEVNVEHVVQALERADEQRAMGPRTGPGREEVVAARGIFARLR